MMPLYGDGDLTFMKFIRALSECSSSPKVTISDICPNGVTAVKPDCFFYLPPQMDALICVVIFILVKLVKLILILVFCGSGHGWRYLELYCVHLQDLFWCLCERCKAILSLARLVLVFEVKPFVEIWSVTALMLVLPVYKVTAVFNKVNSAKSRVTTAVRVSTAGWIKWLEDQDIDKIEVRTTATTLTAKLPILNPGDYDLWLMRIEQYFLMTDYSLWEVIKNGNKVIKKTVGTVKQIYEPTSVEEKLDRKNKMKARGTLLVALPNKDQLKFHSYQDAKLLVEAIEKSIKLRNFRSTFDRLQKLIIRLEIQGSSSTSQNLQNMAFVSPNSTSSTIEADNTAYGVSSAHTQGNTVNSTSVDNLSDVVICAFLASQPNSPQLAREDLEQIDPGDLKEIDLHWEMTMLTSRARRSDKGYHAVPPPYTGNYIPPKPDLMFIDEQVESESMDVVSNVSSSVVKTVESKVESVDVKNKGVYSTVETKLVKKNNFSPLIIEDYISDDESEVEFVPKVENDVIERKNITLIEAARTMLVDSKLPTTFWAKAVNTACYVLNRVLVIKPHNKTPYELIRRRPPLIDFMKPFGYPVTILNTRDYLGKFDEKVDEGFFVGYYVVSKAMRVFNKRTMIVEEALNIRFLENAPNGKGNRPDWLFDIDFLTISMNYVLVVAGFQTNGIAGIKDNIVAGQAEKKKEPKQEYILISICTTDPLISQGPKDSTVDARKKATEVDESQVSNNSGQDDQVTRSDLPINNAGPSFVNAASPSPINVAGTPASTNAFNEHPFERFSPFKNAFSLPHVPIMTLINDTRIFGNAYDDKVVEEEVDMNNVVSSYTIPDAPLTKFLKGHTKDQVIGSIETPVQTRQIIKINEEHVQALKDPSWVETMQDELLQFKLLNVWTLVDLLKDKWAIGTKWVFRNKKDERGIVIKNKARLVSQGHTQEEGIDYDEVFAPVAKIESIRLFLAYASFKDFIVNQMDVNSAFLYEKIEEGVYVCQPYGFKDPDFPNKVYKVEKALYGLHQASRACQEKYVDDILKKFDFTTVKIASTPMVPNKALVNDVEAEDVDVHLYRSIIGSLMYLIASRDSPFDLEAYSDSDYARASLDRKSTIGGCQFFGKRLISWQCKKQTIVANSTTKAEYVVAASYCGQEGIMEKATTTASSLKAEQDSGNINRTQSMATLNEPLPQGTGSGSGPKCQVTILGGAEAQTRYALTVNFIVYDSCVKQFWTTAKVKKVNSQEQIQALVDKQKVIITEESIIRDLKFNDVEGTACLPNDTIFEELPRIGEIHVEKSIPTPSNDPLPSGEDSIQLNELMIFCINLQQVLDLEETKTVQAKKIANLKKRVKKLEKRRKSRPAGLRRLKKVDSSKQVEFSEEKDSLGAQEDASKQGRSIEDIDQDAKIALVDEAHGRMHDVDMFGVDDLEVIVASVEDSAAPTTATTANVDDELTLAKTLIAIKAAKTKVISTAATTVTTAITTPKAKGIVFYEQVQAHIPIVSSSKDKGKAKMIEPDKPLKIKIKIALDEKLEAEMKAKMEEEERIAIKKNEANRAVIEEWNDVQATIDADRECREKPKENSSRKTVPEDGDDVAFEATLLSSQSPTIVDYKIYKERKKSYFKIIRADGNSQNYLTFKTMFKNFNREDSEVLRSIVKGRFKKTKLVDDIYNLLFQTLKTMFEPHVKDIIWKYQQRAVKVNN
nr:hypothetical protein [Tanacetum cinerariifolium]